MVKRMGEAKRQPKASLSTFCIERYKQGRFWAVYADRDSTTRMVCLCVYKKGAREVVSRLSLTSVRKETTAHSV
jgi:hypothetical protein